ncbi:MAG: adenosylcobinamide-GDP ribazoletransferase [Chloroflexota bacterium]|nr:adenosylcobinamide-GDP ribazoletransferase [Chloroflexota bacterium]
MTGLRLAIGFLTVLPMAPAGEARMGPARAWFPLVGLGLGGVLLGLDIAAREALPELVVGAILVAVLLVLTRAIHTEGFLDCCDGLFGGFTREDRLRILRDSHVGAFAVVGGAALLLLKWSALAGIPDDARTGLLLVFPCLSRFGMVATMAAFPYVREQGLGRAFQEGRGWWQVMLGAATAGAAAVLFLGGGGAILFGVAIVVALGLGRWMAGMLGGMTGDTYGAINEVGEVTVLVLGIALFSAIPDLFGAPLW